MCIRDRYQRRVREDSSAHMMDVHTMTDQSPRFERVLPSLTMLDQIACALCGHTSTSRHCHHCGLSKSAQPTGAIVWAKYHNDLWPAVVREVGHTDGTWKVDFLGQQGCGTVPHGAVVSFNEGMQLGYQHQPLRPGLQAAVREARELTSRSMELSPNTSFDSQVVKRTHRGSGNVSSDHESPTQAVQSDPKRQHGHSDSEEEVPVAKNPSGTTQVEVIDLMESNSDSEDSMPLTQIRDRTLARAAAKVKAAEVAARQMVQMAGEQMAPVDTTASSVRVRPVKRTLSDRSHPVAGQQHDAQEAGVSGATGHKKRLLERWAAQAPTQQATDTQPTKRAKLEAVSTIPSKAIAKKALVQLVKNSPVLRTLLLSIKSANTPAELEARQAAWTPALRAELSKLQGLMHGVTAKGTFKPTLHVEDPGRKEALKHASDVARRDKKRIRRIATVEDKYKLALTEIKRLRSENEALRAQRAR
eukprot:TRINITY_DN2222_c0_g1_i1.p1 TRINITY_DN2222_c0_g1~~TRINITY_DN2222_c0_g1_i1.p1  ORF type:complete len:473 (+),score=109.25 TRINITY_DN2222_c0_g1_i1:136-1554(+)